MTPRNRLTEHERSEIAIKLMDLGNIAAGALLFGQAFSGFPFDFRIALLGLLTLSSFYAFAILLLRGGVRP